MIGVLNHDMGNLRSVTNAIYSLGYDYLTVTEPAQFDDLSHLVIPGVGSYFTAIQKVKRLGLQQAIAGFAESARPLLGICLGMQILSTSGEEGCFCEGLGLIPGHVRRLPDAPGYAIPHVGWNGVSFTSDHPVLQGVRRGADFYFVHSYYFDCDDCANVYGKTEYGKEFVSIVGKENVIGLQFHPEKSQSNGLKILENFCEWDGKC
jgi:glutamine amidotransferase